MAEIKFAHDCDSDLQNDAEYLNSRFFSKEGKFMPSGQMIEENY